MHLTKLPVLLK